MSDFDTVTVSDIPEGATILDVRDDYEWAAGHAAGALHVPLDQPPARLGEPAPDENLHLICPPRAPSFPPRRAARPGAAPPPRPRPRSPPPRRRA